MLTNIVSLFLCIIIFSVSLIFRPIYAILVITFFLPMANRLVAFGDVRISFVALLIFSLFLGYTIKKRFTFSDPRRVRYKTLLLLVVTAIFISFGILVIRGLPYNIELLEANITQNVTNYLSAFIAGLIYYLIIVTETYCFEHIHLYVRIFVLTLFFLSVIYFLTNIIGITLPVFISPINIENIGGMQIATTISKEISVFDEVQFAGYIGYIENFAEYLFVLFVFGFVLIISSNRKKIYISMGVTCCILVLMFAVPTAIKAFPIMVALFILSQIILIKNNSVRIGLFLFLIIMGLVSFYMWDYLIETFFLKRLSIIMVRYALLESPFDVLNLNDIVFLIGREDLITIFSNIIETGGFFGIGPVVVGFISGSNIPFHNLYYALYLDFGLFGFFIFITLFVRIIIDLIKTYIKANSSLKMTVLSFLLLFVLLLIEQIKVSMFRIPSGILTFWFVFAMIVCLVNIVIMEKNADKKIKGDLGV